MRKKKKIILVEDNQADVALVKMAFEELYPSVEIIHFYNGLTLMTYLQSCPIQDVALILLDLNMPRMGGIEVLQAFQKQVSLSRIPVIVLSSSAHQKDVDQCSSLGANAYINKPLDIDDFYKMIEAVVAFWLDINIFVDFTMSPQKTFKTH